MGILMKEIDLTTYKKRNQYHWFSTFPDPSYGFNQRIDVTLLADLAKQRKVSFFPYMLFLIAKGVNSIEEMRMREVDGHVYLYDVVHPTFTVMTDEGVYQNAGFLMTNDFGKFERRTRAAIDAVCHLPVSDELDRFPICEQPDVFYSSSIPFLSLDSIDQPTPANNHDSLSVPRIVFDRYRREADGKCTILLNIIVSHTLVDGFPLGRCFENIQEFARRKELFTLR